MNNKILLELMDSFRKEPIKDRGAIISLVLIAWYKASQNVKCPENLKMINCQGIDAENFIKNMHDLSIAMADPAFVIEDRYISRLKQSTISGAISECLRLGASGVLKNFDPTDLATILEEKELVFPVELCDLMVGLAADIENKYVYLPWETGGQFTGRVIKKHARGMVESIRHTNLPELISSILEDEKSISISHNDLLRNPHYVNNGGLIEFPVTIAPLPFGVNVNEDVVERDLYNRFSEKTKSLTVLTVRHILAQTKGRAIITSMNSLLFSSGPERNLREDLLKRQQIEAVVAMPGGLLDITAIPFTILIINTEKRCETVRFVNADSPQFKEEVSRTKNRIINIEQLIETILTSEDSDIVKNVSTQEILKNDAQLQVNRYALGTKERKVAKILNARLREKLEDIATLVKPSSNIAAKDTTPENGIMMYEVGASDIPEYGYIHTASKQIVVHTKFNKTVSQFLIPGDIVLIIKGTLGKVGIIPEDVPAPGVGGWIAGQSAVVIRVEKSSGIDPRALFMLLRSELGKELVKTLESGAAIPFIQLRELKELAIPIPTVEESGYAVNALLKEESLQKQINELQNQQASLSANCWSLKNIEEIGQ